jgi:RNA recognition motif-containing protein
MLGFEVVSAGCAFLKYETKEQAIAAIEALNGVYKMEVNDWFFFLCVCGPGSCFF